ncbi:BING4CT-domain-containing protein [Lizonia empirigonia]|nr:BING4CT-domain-containing protein [Lizonia empirigonia]
MAAERGPKPKTTEVNRKSQKGAPIDDEDARAVARFTEEATKQYGRGERIRPKSVKDKKLRSNLRLLENKNKQAAIEAKNVEILLENNEGLLETEHELERTYKVRQDEIKAAVATETAKKGFELRLDGLGPYDVCEYSRNGRDLLIAGRKGHVATFDWRDGKLGCELQLNETVRDARWLHVSNQKNFAVAQKKCVYIYGGDGVELHQLKNHSEATHLEYLPYHFLLSSISTAGIIRYTDVSTGQSLGELYTKLGQPTAFVQNPHNAILHVGHQKGLVTLWSPNSASPLVKLLPHHGPVRSLAVDKSGTYMVSTSQDRRMSVWDIRMFKEIHTHHLRVPGTSLSISDRNLTAVGYGTQVNIYKPEIFTHNPDLVLPTPYMAWGGEGISVGRVRFCPFEDLLGIGHEKGFTSIIVPGAGEPNPDTLEQGTNPYETSKQRRETEVHALLEKIQPEMIAIDPNFVGNLDLTSHEERVKERDLDRKDEDKIAKLKKRGRGRNSALRRYLRKSGSKNVIDEEKERAREIVERRKERNVEKQKQLKQAYGPALERFAKKGL